MNGSSAMTGVRQIRTSVRMFGRFHMARFRIDAAHSVLTPTTVLSTSLLTALRVSNTPSPFMATASKYGARSIHWPSTCSTRNSPSW